MTRCSIVLTLAFVTAACASAPPAAAAAAAAADQPAGPTFEQKMAWILRLEDQRDAARSGRARAAALRRRCRR